MKKFLFVLAFLVGFTPGRLFAADIVFTPTLPNKTRAPAIAPAGMTWIPGGEFSMGGGSTCLICEASATPTPPTPSHRVYLDGFWMDTTQVTNAQFKKFVDATGYVTIAEQKPSPADFPGVPVASLVPGSLVFTPSSEPVPLTDPTAWWRYQAGANWRHPDGPDSDIGKRMNDPVVQVAFPDAVAYAKWAGKQLPTEAEFEFAARGGLSGKSYAWGDEFHPNGHFMANTYQGTFPVKDNGDDGFVGLSPVKSFPPNAYGLYDMAGNTWQWCADWFQSDLFPANAPKVIRNPQGPSSSNDPEEPGALKRVQRGGSYLCTDQYCDGYRVDARSKGEVNTGTNHVGFRCVIETHPRP